ncbi:MAG: hypothetical protein KKA73_28095, partial [Chloroflexi bacterium]|nr:hypothetical protein [Chloroflexota bacterium]
MFSRDVVDQQALQALAWPAARLGEAIEYLGRKGDISSQPAEASPLPGNLDSADDEAIGWWIEAVADRQGLEAEPTESPYAQVGQLVRSAGPAILRLPDGFCKGDGRFLALLKGGHRRVSIVGPDLAIRRVHPVVVRDALCHDVEAPFMTQTDRFLTGAGVPEHRRVRVGEAILQAQLSPFRIRGCWLLRPSPGASLWLQARRARLPRALFMLIGGNIILQVLTLLAWTVIGWGALTGHFDWGWLWAWALLLFTTIPFQMLITQAQSQLAINAGGLFKQRLLHGTLQLTPEEIR